MASYIGAKKKETLKGICNSCNEEKELVSSIRDEYGVLQDYCRDCFETITGKKVSKR